MLNLLIADIAARQHLLFERDELCDTTREHAHEQLALFGTCLGLKTFVRGHDF
ncbi:hypothetical protein D3C71_1693960 [compost metagenome]